jgi:hypothetical protein
MRASFAAAVLATLTLAAPAAAQPDAAQVLAQAFRVLAASHPPQVQDYTMTLRYQSIELSVYVQREGDEWEVSTPEDAPLGDFAGMAVLWPEFAGVAGDADEEGVLEDAVYVRADQVEGRATHVLTAELGTELESDGLDSVLVYVDASTHHVLRMHLAGVMNEAMGDDFGAAAGGRVEFTLDMLDHRATDGLVVPGRVRVRMRMEMPQMEESERSQARMGIAMARSQLQNSDDPEAKEMLVMMDLFAAILNGDEMDIPMTVEEVRVNSGPPEWVEEN